MNLLRRLVPRGPAPAQTAQGPPPQSKDILHRVVSRSPAILSFFSGLLASTATNLLTALMTAGNANICRLQIVSATLLFLGSAVVVMVQFWDLENSHDRWVHLMEERAAGGNSLTDEQIASRALKGKKRKIWILTILWVGLFIAGMVTALLPLN